MSDLGHQIVEAAKVREIVNQFYGFPAALLHRPTGLGQRNGVAPMQ